MQAYGEYERFLEISKTFMKERGISLKKQLKKKKKNKKQINDQLEGTVDGTTTNEERESIINNNPLGGNESATGDYQEMTRLLDDKLQSNLE